MRHTLEIKTVATLRKALDLGKRGAVVITTTRAKFRREMSKMGFTLDQTEQALRDCFDMAELESLADA